MENFVITIARGFGSGGKELAMTLARELNINCYENRILALASQVTGKETAELIQVDERLKNGLLKQKLRRILSSESREPKAAIKKFESDMEIFQCQCDIIRDLAQKESCIIVGKCADHVLKDFENVASFYIEAPRPYCLKRIMKRMNVDAEEAAKLISKTDKFRADYYKFYTNGNYWTNPVNYDMTINMNRVGQERAVETIISYLKSKFGEELIEGVQSDNTLYSYAENVERKVGDKHV